MGSRALSAIPLWLASFVHMQCLVCNASQIYLKTLSERSECKIFGKAEFQNPGGSIKDRAAVGILRDAEEKGL